MSDMRATGFVGAGMLGRAMARAALERDGIDGPLWIATRSGRVEGLDPARLRLAAPAELAASCDAIVLAVPPAEAARLEIDATGRLVISVMAGVTEARIAELTGADRVIRAMCSPAAEQGLAYAPWHAGPAATEGDRRAAARLLGACGMQEEVPEEGWIDLFTALTGPVPGFVAAFAESAARWAEARGVAPEAADRAVRQLFLAAGRIMSASEATPAAHVRAMIDYAGTTAAGLTALRAAGLDAAVAAGLDAAAARARGIADG